MIQVTDAKGRPKESYLYDAWGNSIFPARQNQPFRFAGQAFDAVPSLYYMRARYYDPSVGRFISRDLFAGSVYIPSSHNRYLFRGDDPTTLVDKSGFAAGHGGGNPYYTGTGQPPLGSITSQPWSPFDAAQF